MTLTPLEIELENFTSHAKYIGRKSDNTIKRYRETIRQFIRHCMVRELSELKLLHVQKFFLEGNRDRNWKRRTYRTYYMSLVVFFDWLVKHNHIPKNYVREIDVPSLDRLLPRCITQSQAEQLLVLVQNYPFSSNLLRTRNYAIFATFIFAGLRKDELFRLKCSDVDLENRTIKAFGKGEKERVIPISNKLVVVLNSYIIERRKTGKITPYFFVSSKKDAGYTNSGLKRLILLFREVCGFYFSAHMLRHTFATLMLKGGCDIYTLSKIMGHSSIKITENYLWLVTDDLRAQLFKHPLEYS